MGSRKAVGPLTLALARRLASRREAVGLSLAALTDLSGLTKPTVVYSLKGEQAITVEAYAALCAALNLDPVALFRDARDELAAQPDPDLPDLSPSQYALAARRMRSRGKALRAELDAAGEESQDEEELL